MEYSALQKQIKNNPKIFYNILETLAYNSNNPIFRTSRFRHAMIEYRRFGNRVTEKAGWSRRDAVYFAKHSYNIHKAYKSTEN